MGKYNAEADIMPARFVTYGATDSSVRQAVADERTCGISNQAQKDAREDCAILFAAQAGDSVSVHDGKGIDTDVEYVLEVGAVAVAYGDLLKPDANGMGVVAAAGDYYGAIAQTSGNPGEFIAVQPDVGVVA